MRIDDGVEELTSGPERPDRPLATRWPAAVVLLLGALVAGAVFVSAESSHSDRAAPRTPHRSAAAAPRDAAQLAAWVFLQPLPECLHAQPQHRLRLAFAVTNFSDDPLRLVGVTAVLGTHGVAVTGLRVGRHPCPTADIANGVELLPSQKAAVEVGLRGEPGCHMSGSVSVRLTFRGSAGLVYHAESTNLLTVEIQRLLGCDTA